MRLTVLCDAGVRGGAEVQLATLLGALAPDVDVVVLARDRAVGTWVAAARPGSRLEVVPPGVRAAVRSLRRAAPDVVHANLPAPWDCRDGLLAALLLRRPVVVVDHLPDWPLSPRGRAWQRLLTARAAARVAVGQASGRALERRVGLPPGTVRVVPNGVPVARPVPRPRPPGPLRLLAVGRLERQKGLDVLLAALPLVPDAELTVVGDGTLRAELAAQVQARGLSDRVALTGPTADVDAAYRRADALVLASRDEAMPLTVLEAMVRGLPVVATDVGSVAEVVHDGRTGLLVPPEDPVALAAALRRLAAEPDRGAAWGAAGRAVALARHDAGVMAATYQALFRSAAG